MVNLYISPSFTKTRFELTEGPLILAGDFNTFLDNYLDRHSGSTRLLTPLHSYSDKFNHVDARRLKRASTREYSCHSDTYATLSHTDLCLLSHDLFGSVAAVRYLPRAISDHFPFC